MGTLREAPAAKLFVGMLSADETLFEQALNRMVERYGPVDLKSSACLWNHTRYYEEELGPDLKRQFLFFQRPIPPEAISDAKRFTHELEVRWSRSTDRGPCRRINLDPGYLDSSKLVLATTKDYAHRIYLRDGIYAEVTLVYRDKSFRPLPHTYPDFRSEESIALFNRARGLITRAGSLDP